MGKSTNISIQRLYSRSLRCHDNLEFSWRFPKFSWPQKRTMIKAWTLIALFLLGAVVMADEGVNDEDEDDDEGVRECKPVL